MLTVQDKIDILKVNMYAIDAVPGKVFAYDDSNVSDFYYSQDVGDLPVQSVIENVVNAAYEHLLLESTCN
jgi:hypothetical protein